MSANNAPLDDDDELKAPKPTPVIDLPYYNTLREVMAPYTAASDAGTATDYFFSAEIIQSIEQHHGVPQGPVKGDVKQWVYPADFVRAMHYLGFRESSAGGLQLQWLCCKK